MTGHVASSMEGTEVDIGRTQASQGQAAGFGEINGVVESLTRLSEASQQNPCRELLMNSVPFGVLLLDSELRLLAANKAYSIYFDQATEFSLGAPLQSLLPHADESGIVAILRRALKTGRTIPVRNFRYDGFGKGATYWNGSAIPVRLSADDGPYDSVAMVALEVTEEIVAREQLASLAVIAEHRAAELEAQHAQLNAVIEAAPVALVVCDIQARITAFNSAAREHYESLGMIDRLGGDVPISTPWSVTMHGDDGEELAAQQLPIMRSLGGERCFDEVVHYHPAPPYARKIACVNSAPIRNANGLVTGAVAAISDITQDRRIQEEIEENYQREHAIATKLQESFTARDMPEVEGFAYAQAYRPARDSTIVGGDFYDIFRVADGKYAVVMADVAGKGLNSVAYTAMTKFILRAYALEDCDPAGSLVRLNDALCACTPSELFVTLVYGILDCGKKTFTYANAGHEHPLLRRNATGEAHLLEVTGPAIALQKGSTYGTREIALEPGDVLVFYTDGITDAGTGTDRLGQERLLELLAVCGDGCMHEFVSSTVALAQDYAGGRLADDIALLAIKAL